MRRLRTCKRDDERGAVALEAAVILPVLLLITFGAIEFGLVFRNSLTIASSSRAGARAASAQPRESDYQTSTADAVKGSLLVGVPYDSIRYLSIFKADRTTGRPVDGDFETCTTCYRYTWDIPGRKWAAVPGPKWPHDTQSACGGPNDTDYIGVYVRVEHDYITGMFGSKMDLTDHSVMRLEPIATSAVCKP